MDEVSVSKYTDKLNDSLTYIFNELKCVTLDIFGKDSHVFNRVCYLEEVIKEFYSEYEDSFHYLMYSSNSYSPCNMMICRKELFDDYCEWLFGVLKKVEERVHIQYYTPYQARIFGFMSERLLNVYCIHHHLRVKHYKILSFVSGKNRPVILELLGHFRSFLSFELTKKI